MASESFRITTFIGASPEEIYEAWLSSDGHSAMTGGEATVDPGVGGRFTAWGPYIQGRTLELERAKRIVQSWRTSEFSPDDEDSRVEVSLEPQEGGTRIVLFHDHVPQGQGTSYRSGWEEFYFAPMRRYFLRNAETERPPPAVQATVPETRVAKEAAKKKRAAPARPATSRASAARAKPAKRAASSAKKKPAVAKKKAAAAPRATPAKKRAATAKKRAATPKRAVRGRAAKKKTR